MAVHGTLRFGKLVFLSFCICLGSTLLASAPGAESPGLTANDFFWNDRQLRDLIGALLIESPAARAADARADAAHAAAGRERSLPRARLTYRAFLEPIETRLGPQSSSVELVQPVPWPGSRRHAEHRKMDLAQAGRRGSESLRRELVADLKRRYYGLALAVRELEILQDEIRLLRSFEEIALTRYSTGEGFQQSVVQVQTEINRLREREIGLEQKRERGRQAIARLVPHIGPALVDDPDRLELPDTFDQSEWSLPTSHPALAQRRLATDSSRKLLEHCREMRRPDLRVGLSYNFIGKRTDLAAMTNPIADDGRDALSLTLGFDIPLDRRDYRGAVSEAASMVEAHEHEYRDVEDRLEDLLLDARERFEAAYSRARLYRGTILPQAREALSSARGAYTNNRLDFRSLLDAQRVLFEARRSYERLVADSWLATVDAELGLAEPFPTEVAP